MVGKLLYPDQTGHSTVEYDTEKPETLVEAGKLFDEAIKRGDAVFNMDTKERIKTWDPTTAAVLPSEILVTKPLQGG